MREALEQLLPLERNLFFALNGSNSLFLDNVMWTVTGRLIWIPMIFLLLFLMFYRTHYSKAILTTIFLILVIVLCDQISSSILKPFFERPRPTHHPDFAELVDIVNGYRGGAYGFVSDHAANSFGISTFVSLLFKNRKASLIAILWATLNSYSRIYLGVHFISDILGGMILGVLIALMLMWVYRLLEKRFFKNSVSAEQQAIQKQKGNYFALSLAIYIPLIVAFSFILCHLPH